jgi:hypothetical protein
MYKGGAPESHLATEYQRRPTTDIPDQLERPYLQSRRHPRLETSTQDS